MHAARPAHVPRTSRTVSLSLQALAVLAFAVPAGAQDLGDTLKRTVKRAAESEVQRKAEREARRATRCALGDARCATAGATPPAAAGGAQAAGPAGSTAGGGDHPLLPRYEGSRVLRRDFDEFTDYTLRTGKSKATGSKTLEGRVTRLTYEGPADRAVLEVFRNYEQQLRADGFTILFSCAREQCGDIRKEIESGPRYMLLWGGGDHRYLAARRAGAQGEVHVAVWVTRNSGGGAARGRPMVQADVIESGAMETRMALVDADALGRDIAQDGRAVLHGIHFDVDRDTLRPDAAPQIAEIARLLQGDPALRVRVVGHTDAQGRAAHNADLSRRRAQRIVDVLVREHGIARSRLAPEGRGAGEPVADNATEAGRAQNRRVEIIRR